MEEEAAVAVVVAINLPDKFSAKQKHDAIVRELEFRRGVYSNLVRQGKMTPHQAAFQIRIFEAIRDDYFELSKGERLL